MRTSRLLVLVAMVLPSLGLAGGPASATTKGGLVHVWSSGDAVTTPILFTGAIADYGTATSQDQNGKADENGVFEKAVLKKGSFLIDARPLNAALANLRPTFDATNCSGFGSGSGPTKIVAGSGTGAYKGIKGTITITITFASIGPKLASGKCNQSDNAPSLSEYSTVTGSGVLSFS